MNNIPNTRTMTEYEVKLEAYLNLQHYFDRQDVRDCLERYDYDCTIEEQFGVTSDEAYSLIPQIASRYREYVDNDDTWECMLMFAIADVCDEYIEEEERAAK